MNRVIATIDKPSPSNINNGRIPDDTEVKGPRFSRVCMSALVSDPRRQRDINEAHKNQLAVSWSWKHYEPIVVFERNYKNGEMAIWKGHHRFLAIKEQPEFKEKGGGLIIQVFIIPVYSPEEEEELWQEWVRSGEGESPVILEKPWSHGQKSLFKWMQGDPEWKAIADMVSKHGLSIQYTPLMGQAATVKDWRGISSTKSLEVLYRESPERLGHTLGLVSECWLGLSYSTHPSFLKGLFLLLEEFPDVTPKQWVDIKERFRKIDPNAVRSGAKSLPARYTGVRRHYEALLEIHKEWCGKASNPLWKEKSRKKDLSR